jgi:hypothetical protein
MTSTASPAISMTRASTPQKRQGARGDIRSNIGA